MEFIQKQLNTVIELLKKENILKKDFFTLEEAAIYLGQSKSSLYKLTSKKKLPHYVPNGKMIYFKRVELDDWITNTRVSTEDNFELSIDNYLSKPLNN